MARRNHSTETKLMSPNTFFLEPVAPFRLDLTVWTLRRRPHNLIDRWDGETYRRTLIIDGIPIEVEVIQTGPPETPQIRVTVIGSPLRHDGNQAVTAALERLLGLRIDLTEFYRLAHFEAGLGSLAQRFRGMKPPRFLSVFEGVVNAIANQQVSLTVGIHLLSRLSRSHGLAVEGVDAHAFPRPMDIATIDPQALRQLGFSSLKGRAMVELAQNSDEDYAELEQLSTLSDDDAVARLCQLRGVGRWSAEYVLLRTLGRLNVFPGDDVGARNNLQRWLELADPLDYDGVAQLVDRWQPYAGLIYFHLLLRGLTEAGHIKVSGDQYEEDLSR
ncbi:MAG: DNA-3-methyladenine glycosylase 2 family protein [Chthonomonadales bacterium]